MTTANCPRCSEQVSVPDSASREAIVRCPYCQDEYSLGEALAQLPPSLIVVSSFPEGPGTAVATEEDSPWAALDLDDDYDGEETALSPLSESAPVAAFDFTSGPETATARSKTTIRPSSRARKPTGSPIKSILSIVAGGLLAFPIAQLILWYLPGDWKRDFGAGPIVAQYVPQIVPAKFRGSLVDEESNSGPASQNSDSVIPDFNFGGGQFAEAASTSGDTDGIASGEQPQRSKRKPKTTDPTALPNELAAEDQMSTEAAAAAGADVFGSSLEVPGLELNELPLIDPPASPSELPKAVSRVTEEPTEQPPSPDGVPLTTEAAEPKVASLAAGSIRNAPRVSADEVEKSVQAAVSGKLAWDNDPASTPSASLKREFYLSFSKLAEALTFADRADENVAVQIQETKRLLQEVATQSDKLAMIRTVAKGWIQAGHQARKTDGICLAGVVTSVEPIGNFFETIVESGGHQIAVISTSDPASHFTVDRQVLVLGTIVDDPAQNFGGYEGNWSIAVCDAVHVNIADE